MIYIYDSPRYRTHRVESEAEAEQLITRWTPPTLAEMDEAGRRQALAEADLWEAQQVAQARRELREEMRRVWEPVSRAYLAEVEARYAKQGGTR